MIRILLASLDSQCQHVVEMGVEEYLVFVHHHDMLAMDIHHVVPDIHFLAKETTQNTVGKEYTFQVEVGTDHHISHRYILWDDGYLVFIQFHL